MLAITDERLVCNILIIHRIILQQFLGSFQIGNNTFHHLVSRHQGCAFRIKLLPVRDARFCRILRINRSPQTQQIKIMECTQTKRLPFHQITIPLRHDHISVCLKVLQEIIDICDLVI